MFELSRFLVILFSVLFCQICFAKASTYECIVLEEKHLSNGGLLEAYPKPLALAQHFSVNRDSGALVEPNSVLWSLKDSKISILAQGNKQNNFVVLYVSPSAGEGVHSTMLTVEEPVESIKKPFLLLSNTSVYTGICE